jgi:hypothetical protein
MDRINGWAEILHLLGDPQSLQENSMPLNPQLPVAPKSDEGGPVAPKPGEGGSKPSAEQLNAHQPSTINHQLVCPPRLFFHQRCARLIETLPALQHDPNRPEDILKVDADEDGNGGDDAADALRYLVATKARTIVQRKLRGL